MLAGKTEYKAQGVNLKDRKKRKFRKRLRRICYLAGLLIAAVILLLALLHRPTHYNPPEFADDKLVSPYLTNVLGPAFNNGLQLGEPFDLPVDQNGINEVIVWSYKHKWSNKFGDVGFSAPEVFFTPNTITLMGAVTVAGREFVVTVAAKPALSQDGLLNLRVTKVKVGAVNITLIARIIARAAYRKRLETKPIDKDDVRAKIWASVLYNEPFDPVFRVRDAYEKKRKVRLKKLTIEPQKLTLRLSPLPHNNE